MVSAELAAGLDEPGPARTRESAAIRLDRALTAVIPPWFLAGHQVSLVDPLRGAPVDEAPLALPVQYVAKDGDGTGNNPRVLWGRIAQGQVQVGDEVQILPSGQTGVVAESGGQVVGWCHVGPWQACTIMDDRSPEPLAPRLAAVSCFVIAPAWRGRGVARALLTDPRFADPWRP